MGIVQSKRKWKEAKHTHTNNSGASRSHYMTGDHRSSSSSSTLQSLSAKSDASLAIHTRQSSPKSNSQTNKLESPQKIDYNSFQSDSFFLPKDWEVQDQHQSLHFAVKALFGDTLTSVTQHKFYPGARIVDIGCGNGYWLMDLASQYPDCFFVGIVSSPEDMPNTLLLPNIQFEIVNLVDGLELDDNSVDLVHMRGLSLSCTLIDWSDVLREVYRVLKPSGIVQLEEILFAPTETALIESFIETVRNIMLAAGMDYDIAQNQPKLIQTLGFKLMQSTKNRINFASAPGNLGSEFISVILHGFEYSRSFLAPRMGLSEEDYLHRVEMVCAQCVRNDSHLYWYNTIGTK
ncbi:S-adenosyl-L-methionine-dependent methyltransferase [Spinellus fusiger]|nr:S-adenosyl-L-methionine-dependent methyltransferase [Spinellus fusiger]